MWWRVEPKNLQIYFISEDEHRKGRFATSILGYDVSFPYSLLFKPFEYKVSKDLIHQGKKYSVPKEISLILMNELVLSRFATPHFAVHLPFTLGFVYFVYLRSDGYLRDIYKRDLRRWINQLRSGLVEAKSMFSVVVYIDISHQDIQKSEEEKKLEIDEFIYDIDISSCSKLCPIMAMSSKEDSNAVFEQMVVFMLRHKKTDKWSDWLRAISAIPGSSRIKTLTQRYRITLDSGCHHEGHRDSSAALNIAEFGYYEFLGIPRPPEFGF
ncbi:hypothetical protein ADUPG1_009729 [Aduncisulcus paluster]|uniref:Uncharacterized protein n=1 Tax=Aduncisulcus paluster TaxID=2918883 RepID=A0ABQ5KWK3_9EUKA|nr:hypothetical protein ADUPG1_009729 [Aduncisulcus paluster]